MSAGHISMANFIAFLPSYMTANVQESENYVNEQTNRQKRDGQMDGWTNEWPRDILMPLDSKCIET